MPTSGPYRTRDDLARKALANLGVLAAGQPPDPEDFSYVDNDLDSIMRTLAALDIVYVPDLDNIPSIWFEPLADIVADQCATKFGLPPDDFDKLKRAGLGIPPGTGAAALALKAINRGRPTYAPLQADYM